VSGAGGTVSVQSGFAAGRTGRADAGEVGDAGPDVRGAGDVGDAAADDTGGAEVADAGACGAATAAVITPPTGSGSVASTSRNIRRCRCRRVARARTCIDMASSSVGREL
jgi:hypothetical protein